jgi:hypothetical protein
LPKSSRISSPTGWRTDSWGGSPTWPTGTKGTAVRCRGSPRAPSTRPPSSSLPATSCRSSGSSHGRQPRRHADQRPHELDARLPTTDCRCVHGCQATPTAEPGSRRGRSQAQTEEADSHSHRATAARRRVNRVSPALLLLRSPGSRPVLARWIASGTLLVGLERHFG